MLFPFFLLLLSYQLTLAFYPLTAAQKEVFRFLGGEGELDGRYTPTEISHLQDVQQVMQTVDWWWYASFILTLGVLLYFWKDREQLWKLLKYGSLTAGIGIAIIILFLLFAFNSAFTLFHLLFFPQGNWQFAADSLLIQTFPAEFFVGISRIVFIVALCLSLGIFFWSRK